LYGTNIPGSAFNTTFDADFVNGVATVNSQRTEFDYPLEGSDNGCYFNRSTVDHCVEQAAGQVLALCTSAGADVVAIVGIGDDLEDSNIGELRARADTFPSKTLSLRALTCDNELDDDDAIDMEGTATGGAVQRFGATEEPLSALIVGQLFNPIGRPVFPAQGGGPEVARVGAKTFKHIDADDKTTYYIVTFGSRSAGQSQNIPPKVFVSAALD
jgi:hypothetical protein